MKEIRKNLFVGNQNDYENFVKFQSNWFTVHACKEPYHRKALGYTGRTCSKNNPEYLVAIRGNELNLNLIDVENENWIPSIIINEALSFIKKALNDNKKVLVHCNQGHSRSPIIGLLFLATEGYFQDISFEEAEEKFKEIYPDYSPAGGVKGYAKTNWMKYNNRKIN